MVQWHEKSDKKASGGRRQTVNRCDKKKAWMGGSAANTKTEENSKEDRKERKGRGNTKRVRLTHTQYANVVMDKKTNKMQKLAVIAVKTNDANRLFARSNISTKGAIIRVKVGSEEKAAKVTSRPGQNGTVNATLLE